MNRTNCDVCKKDMSWKMAQVTINRFQKALCIDCQIEHIKKTYPAKLAEYTIHNLMQYKLNA